MGTAHQNGFQYLAYSSRQTRESKNEALGTLDESTLEKSKVTLTFTRVCSDPNVDYYDELLLFDAKKQCIGYFSPRTTTNILC